MKKWMWIVLAIIVVSAIVYGVYTYNKKQAAKKTTIPAGQTGTTTSQTTTTSSAGNMSVAA